MIPSVRLIACGILVLTFSTWSARDAAAYGGATGLEFDDESDLLSGFTTTWKDWWDWDSGSTCTWYDPEYGCLRYEYRERWASVIGELYAPSGPAGAAYARHFYQAILELELHQPESGHWEAYGHHHFEEDVYIVEYDQWFGWWYWYFVGTGYYYFGTTGQAANVPGPPCGDERDVMIEEYRAGQVAWTPVCSDFASSGGTTHFSWSELNGHFQDGNPHPPWGIVRQSLMTGLEETRANYNRGGLRLTSGYRCPHGNAQVGGVQQSLHMHGRASDMFSLDHPWTEEEFNRVRQAALLAGAVEALFWNTYTDRHFHAAW